MTRRYSVTLDKQIGDYIDDRSERCSISKSSILKQLIVDGKRMEDIREISKDSKRQYNYYLNELEKTDILKRFDLVISELFMSNNVSLYAIEDDIIAMLHSAIIYLFDEILSSDY